VVFLRQNDGYYSEEPVDKYFVDVLVRETPQMAEKGPRRSNTWGWDAQEPCHSAVPVGHVDDILGFHRLERERVFPFLEGVYHMRHFLCNPSV
jgi:hypothetical protein